MGLPDYFDWTHVIRCALHRLNGPSKLLLEPLTKLERRYAKKQAYGFYINIDYKSKSHWRPRRDGSGTTIKKGKKKKKKKTKMKNQLEDEKNNINPKRNYKQLAANDPIDVGQDLRNPGRAIMKKKNQ
ncbi:LOW QUALITY PROTEIN: hypothetical protein PanWU01x14_088510 [Parasponia andersonii]|uniref:Uncharacterized protein n=1 Tax=Parasponia andersonii TaxID=3476 RepID=A0A2P5D7X9_PARAD|nr:LOW QUALITY PROTEIN: hypothetical protein PanWU01x14_088510 [Parasponia andersonii]